MPFIGAGVFALVAILCIYAWFAARKQRRHDEETGSLDESPTTRGTST